MRFIKDEDYSVLIRDEIKNVLLRNYTETSLANAESMAIAQLKNYLSGRYDIESIFNPEGVRNAHIIMLVIDCSLYHLYSSMAPNKIPEHRAARYQDALNWLKDISRGNSTADLPKQKDKKGSDQYPFIITSENPNENNRW